MRPDHIQIMAALADAEQAIFSARATRRALRRRQTPLRSEQLLTAREECAAAAKPLRSWLGMVAWGGISLEDELAMKNIMIELRYERRQIDKMRL